MTRSRLRTVLAAAVGLGLAAATVVAVPASAAPALSWQLRSPGGGNHYRGLAAVSAKVAWISGYQGQVLRTTDGGTTWEDVSPTTPGASALQFRDIEATDTEHAVVMSVGDAATQMQLLVTDDGGAHWSVANANTNPAAFYDCMSFSDGNNGLVMSDPVDGKFRILRTRDGGHSWSIVPNTGMPRALKGEAGFAASGECLTTVGDDAWFGTGGGSAARIFHSTDGGTTWTASASGISAANGGGVFGLAFSTPSRGVAVGGYFSTPTVSDHVASTQLIGRPWQPSASMPHGYRSGVTFVPGTLGTFIAVGLSGSDISRDGGKTWTTITTGQYDTVSCTADGSCWAAGDYGRVAVLQGL